MKQPIYAPDYLITMANKSFNCDVLDSTRKRQNVYGRMAISFYLRQYNGMTFSVIGKIFKKDHASIHHYLKEHYTGVEYDQCYSSLFDNFERELKRSFSLRSYTLENCREKVKQINDDLLELGYSFPEIEVFWNECINEVKK